MNVQELCRQLKPIIGVQADRYWLAYLSEDATGKQEMEIALQLLAARHIGADVTNPEVPLSAPHKEIAAGAYPIGDVVYSNRTLHSFGMREDEWIQHTAIFGRSGAGKTNTIFVLLESLLNQDKPFLIFDWKRNYRDLLSVRKEEILVYTVGRKTVPFTFNPLIPPKGTDTAVWLKKLIEIIAHSYYLGEGVMFLLQEALHSVYSKFGLYQGDIKERPTLNDVYHWLSEYPVKGRKALWMDSAMRGIKSICFGHMGKVVNTQSSTELGSLLEKNVILELDGLTNADKTFIIESMLLWIHHHRLAQPYREKFKHALIIEEAHHILLKRTGGQGGEAITDTILREIRELGEAIVLVDQHPSLISIPALGNTYTTITMNLKHKSDVSAIGAAMLMDDEQRIVLGRLPVGSAIVKLQGRWIQPFAIKIPYRPVPKGSVDDSKLAKLMGRWIVLPQNPDPCIGLGIEHKSETLSETEISFLTDVLKKPLSGTVQRYKQLGFSRRKGNSIREECIRKELLALVEIPIRNGKVVLCELTDKGRRLIRDLGHEIPTKQRWGSVVHEYWKNKVAQRLQNIGWNVEFEVPVNGFTDIIAKRGSKKIAIEIETGKSDWKKNLVKNRKKGFSIIFILATNQAAYLSISKDLKGMENNVHIEVNLAQEFINRRF